MERMRRLTIVWGIVMIIIFGSLTTFGLVYKKQVKAYKDKELELEEFAKKYVNDNLLNNETETIHITKEELLDFSHMEEVKVGEDICDCYVKVKDYNFKAYLKCASYETKGY